MTHSDFERLIRTAAASTDIIIYQCSWCPRCSLLSALSGSMGGLTNLTSGRKECKRFPLFTVWPPRLQSQAGFEEFSRVCVSESGQLCGELLQWVALLSGWNICFFWHLKHSEEMIRLVPAPMKSSSSGSIGWPALSLCGPSHLWAGLCDRQLVHDNSFFFFSFFFSPQQFVFHRGLW